MPMNLECFRRRYELPLASLRSLITESVLSTGNKEEDCQQLTILNRLSALEHALDGTTESDLIPHAIFREPISCVEDAQRLFRYLHQHDLLFHPEEPPEDITHHDGTALFTEDEARELRHRMSEAWQQEWSEYECPCGFCISIDEERQA